MDVLCFSHLRWNFVYQRPNHLLSRAARRHRVFFVEEPIRDAIRPWTDIGRRDGVEIVTPHLRPGSPDAERAELRDLLDSLIATRRVTVPLLWYDTPLAVPWSRHLLAGARAVVYDCPDSLARLSAPPWDRLELDRELMAAADLVFTASQSAHALRATAHPAVHHFPSSVDVAHFARARGALAEPPDQAAIPHPRLGHLGTLDEQVDIGLLRFVVAQRPDWHLVLIGPTSGPAQAGLPTASNVHVLGIRAYGELPAYLAGWDTALLPVAMSPPMDVPRRASIPARAAELLAAGRPVAATAVADIVEPFGRMGIVHVAGSPDGFVAAIEAALADDRGSLAHRADALLAERSWDATWAAMEDLLEGAIVSRALHRPGAIRAPAAAPSVAGTADEGAPIPSVGPAGPPQPSKLPVATPSQPGGSRRPVRARSGRQADNGRAGARVARSKIQGDTASLPAGFVRIADRGSSREAAERLE